MRFLLLSSISFKSATLTKYPLSSWCRQYKGLAFGEHQPRLEVLQRQQRSTFSYGLHKTSAHSDLTVSGLQFVDDVRKVSVLLRVDAAIRCHQLHELQDLSEMLQRPVDQGGEVGSLARYLGLRDELHKVRVGAPGLVN